jgi:hypothetical protein
MAVRHTSGVSKHVEMTELGGGFGPVNNAVISSRLISAPIARSSVPTGSFSPSRPTSLALPPWIDIKPHGAGSLLTLTHQLDPEWGPRDAGIRAGWEGILEGLARASGEIGNGHTLIMHRTFDAQRILVWKAWTEAEHLVRWICPAGFRVLFAENEALLTIWRGLRADSPRLIFERPTICRTDPKSQRLPMSRKFQRRVFSTRRVISSSTPSLHQAI